MAQLSKKISRSKNGSYTLCIKGMDKDTISVLLDLLSNFVSDYVFLEYCNGVQLPMLSVASSVRMLPIGRGVYTTPNFVLKQLALLFNKTTDLRAIETLYSFNNNFLKPISNGRNKNI